MMLSRELGLPHDVGQHAAYVQSWIKVLKEDPMEIVHAAKDSQRIMEYVKGFEREQSIQKDIATLKETYQQQSALLPPEEKAYRQTLESFVEKATLGLSEPAKQQSQLHFYQHQVQEIKQYTQQSLFPDTEIER